MICGKHIVKQWKNSYEEDGDATSIGSCFQWLEELGWKKMKDDEMAEEITNIKILKTPIRPTTELDG